MERGSPDSSVSSGDSGVSTASSTSETTLFQDTTISMTLDGIIDAVVVSDTLGDILFANVAATNMFGYSKKEFVGKNVAALMPDPWRSRHATFMSSYSRTGQAKLLGITRSLKGQRSDGFVFPLDISLGFFSFNSPTSEKLFVATLRESQIVSPESATPSESSGSSGDAPQIDDISKLLTFYELGDCVGIFRDERVDGKTFYLLSESDLKGMGIKVGPRRKIMSIIADHQRRMRLSPNPVVSKNVPEQRSLSSTSSASLTIESEELVFLDILGRGSFGIVYRGLWKDGPVAIKKIMTSEERESHLLGKIRHKNIVQCFGVLRSEPSVCLVMELGKCNLKQAIHLENARMDPNKLMEWMAQIARGMNYLHSECVETILHRDLKPGNILVFDDGSLKITDFGLSKVRDLDITEKMSAVGTFEYMAPEVIQNLPYSEKADVYSFGVVAWEMLTQQIPYKGLPSLSVAFGVGSGTLRLPIPSDCHPMLSMLLSQCLEREYSRRPTFHDLLLLINLISKSDFSNVRDDTFRSWQDSWRLEVQEILGKFEKDTRTLQEREDALTQAEFTLNKRERDLLERETKVKRTYSADFQCFYSGKTFEEETLGIGLVIRQSRGTSSDFSCCDISSFFISASAYFSPEETVPSGKSHPRTDFTNWLPLYISQEHGEKTEELLKAAIDSIVTGTRQQRKASHSLSAADCIGVFSRVVDLIVSLIVEGTGQVEKAQDSYLFCHRQLLALTNWIPSLVSWSEAYFATLVKSGLSSAFPSGREVLTSGKFTEAFLVLTLLPHHPWRDCSHTFVETALELLWISIFPSIPHLKTLTPTSPEALAGVDQKRFMKDAFAASRAALHSFMIKAYFVQFIGRSQGLSLKEIAQRHDTTWGKSTNQIREDFVWNLRTIASVSTYEEFFQNVGFHHQERSSFDLLVKMHASARSRGYLDNLDPLLY